MKPDQIVDRLLENEPEDPFTWEGLIENLNFATDYGTHKGATTSGPFTLKAIVRTRGGEVLQTGVELYVFKQHMAGIGPHFEGNIDTMAKWCIDRFYTELTVAQEDWARVPTNLQTVYKKLAASGALPLDSTDDEYNEWAKKFYQWANGTLNIELPPHITVALL